VIAEPITEQIVVPVRMPGAMPLTWAKATVYAALGGNAAADAAAGRRQPWEPPATQGLACMASRALADSGFRGLRVEASGIGREWTVFDADQVDLDALVIRPWRAGDRIRPFGMSGAKKLSDLFVDEKVPRPVRSRLAVLAMGDEALWVMGVRASAEGAVTSSTRRIAVLAADMDDSIDDA